MNIDVEKESGEKLIQRYIEKELERQGTFLISEYFTTNTKEEEMLNAYTLYSHMQKEQVEEKIGQDLRKVEEENDYIRQMLEELSEYCKMHDTKSTLQACEINKILDKYKSKIKWELEFIDSTSKVKTKTRYTSTFKKKIAVELLKVAQRIVVLKQIKALKEVKVVASVKYDYKKVILEIVNNKRNIKFIELGKDILVHDNKKIQITKIKDLKKFISEMLKIKYKESTESLYYRGHADIKWKLVPSIYREQWIKHEDQLFKELIIRHPTSFQEQKSTFEILTKMQHYELPTRLLDVTTNPLIALYFACCAQSDTIAEVFVFKVKNEEVKYYDSDTVSCIANISKIPYELKLSNLPEDINEFNKIDEVKKLLHEIKNEKPHFENKIDKRDLQKAIFVKPKLDNQRIIRQGGAFILFGIDEEKYSPAKMKMPTSSHKYVIAPEDKRQILNELKRVGISSSTIFPELDKTAQQLKSEYAFD